MNNARRSQNDQAMTFAGRFADAAMARGVGGAEMERGMAEADKLVNEGQASESMAFTAALARAIYGKDDFDTSTFLAGMAASGGKVNLEGATSDVRRTIAETLRLGAKPESVAQLQSWQKVRAGELKRQAAERERAPHDPGDELFTTLLAQLTAADPRFNDPELQGALRVAAQFKDPSGYEAFKKAFYPKINVAQNAWGYFNQLVSGLEEGYKPVALRGVPIGELQAAASRLRADYEAQAAGQMSPSQTVIIQTQNNGTVLQRPDPYTRFSDIPRPVGADGFGR